MSAKREVSLSFAVAVQFAGLVLTVFLCMLAVTGIRSSLDRIADAVERIAPPSDAGVE